MEKNHPNPEYSLETQAAILETDLAIDEAQRGEVSEQYVVAAYQTEAENILWDRKEKKA